MIRPSTASRSVRSASDSLSGKNDAFLNVLREYRTLWDLIREHVKPAEVEDVRKTLGESIVMKSEGLKAEVESYLEILGEYKKQIDDLARVDEELPQRDAGSIFTIGSDLDPRMLQEQVRALLGTLQERAEQEGVDAHELMDIQGSGRDAQLVSFFASQPLSEKEQSGEGMAPNAQKAFTRVNAHQRVLYKLVEREAVLLEGYVKWLQDRIESESRREDKAMRFAREHADVVSASVDELRAFSQRLERRLVATTKEGSSRGVLSEPRKNGGPGSLTRGHTFTAVGVGIGENDLRHLPRPASAGGFSSGRRLMARGVGGGPNRALAPTRAAPILPPMAHPPVGPSPSGVENRGVVVSPVTETVSSRFQHRPVIANGAPRARGFDGSGAGGSEGGSIGAASFGGKVPRFSPPRRPASQKAPISQSRGMGSGIPTRPSTHGVGPRHRKAIDFYS